MTPIYIYRTVVLDSPVVAETLPGNLYQGENSAHCFVISAKQDGQPMELEGTVSGRCVRSDGVTVLLTGSLSRGRAVVTLPGNCYNVNGRVQIAIFITWDERTMALYSANGTVRRSQSESIIDPGHDLDISDILAEIDRMETAATAAENAAGSIDGVRAMAGESVGLGDAITGKFPNWNTMAIWDGADYKYYQQVPVTPGATYRWSGLFNSVCGAWFLDASKNNLTGSGVNTQIFTAPSNAYYVNIGTRGLDVSPTLTRIGNLQVSIDGKTSFGGLSYVTVGVTTQAGAITKYGSVNGSEGVHAIVDVKPGEEYLITGYVYDALYPDDDPGGDSGFIYPLAFCANTSAGESTTIPYSGTIEGPGMVYQVAVTIPAFADKLYINSRTASDIAVLRKVDTVHDKVRQLSGNLIGCNWEGKTIVWFGTSIPAGGLLGTEHPMSYPYLVGKALGATVINEAVGSSCVHCKNPAFITAANPRGFNPNFEASSRCLINTPDDIQWIIDNANASFWTNKGEYDGGTWWQNKLFSFGYTQKLLNNMDADLFVFDHGYNDPYVSDEQRAQYIEDYPVDAWQYSYNAAMDFLIRNILSHNPAAKILIVGVKDPSKANTQRMQAEVAQAWSIPMINTWQYLGWSKRRTIQQYGHWVQSGSDYEWVTDSSLHEMTMFERWVPDGIHPHSYPGHVAEQRVADAIAQWMMGRMQYTEPLAAYWDDIEALIAGMIAANNS